MVEWSILSNDLKICHVVYEYNQRTEKIWFSKLVEELEGVVSKVTISKSIDRLFDLGVINGSWEKVEGKWTRVISIAGEAESFVKNVYENTERPSPKTKEAS